MRRHSSRPIESPRPSHRAAAVMLGVCFAVVLGLVPATPAQAGSGGGKGAANSFWDLAAQSPIVALVVIKEAPPDAAAWTVEIQRAYRGVSVGMVTIPRGPSDLDLRTADRVLLFTSTLENLDIGSLIARFPVDPEGRILAPDDILDAPGTIAEVDAFLGPPPTSAPAAVESGPRTRDQVVRDALPFLALAYVLAVLGVGLAVAWIAGRHLARSR